MATEGRSDSPFRAKRMQPARRNASEFVPICSCEIASPLADFDDWCVSTLAAHSQKIWGSQLSVEDVRTRFQPTLRVYEKTGSQSLRLKINISGKSAVRMWIR